MATMQDVWNEVDRRDQAVLEEVRKIIGDTAGGGGSTPPASAGGLPIHNNLHHEPPLAIASDLTAHIATIASADDLGHVRVGSGLLIDVDGILSVDGSTIEFDFLDLGDVDAPAGYVGQSNKVVIVKDDESGLEFHTLTAADVGALTQAVADTLYDELGAASDAIAAHLLAADPHPQYLTSAEADALFLTPAEGNAAYSALGHIQAVTAGGTNLTSIAQDNIIYSSAANTFTATPITAFGRALIDDANAATARATLELGAGQAGDIWVNLAGDTMTGNLIIQKATATLMVEATGLTNSVLIFDSPVGTQAQLNFYAGGLGRWVLVKNSATETGVNHAGSDLQLLRRDDAGNALGGVLYVERETGFVGINRSTAAAVEYQLDVLGTIRADAATGGVLALTRADSSVSLNDAIGVIDFISDDDPDLSTKFAFAKIEAQAAHTVNNTTTANMPTGRIHLKTTGPVAGTDPVDRAIVGCARILTDAATSLFDVTLNAGEMAGGTIFWTIIASDGTDHQAYSGITTYAAVNKAGTYTSQITHNTSNDAKAVSSGTLTATWSVLNSTNRVTIRVTPSGSLTETTYRILYSIYSNSQQSIAMLTTGL